MRSGVNQSQQAQYRPLIKHASPPIGFAVALFGLLIITIRSAGNGTPVGVTLDQSRFMYSAGLIIAIAGLALLRIHTRANYFITTTWLFFLWFGVCALIHSIPITYVQGCFLGISSATVVYFIYPFNPRLVRTLIGASIVLTAIASAALVLIMDIQGGGIASRLGYQWAMELTEFNTPTAGAINPNELAFPAAVAFSIVMMMSSAREPKRSHFCRLAVLWFIGLLVVLTRSRGMQLACLAVIALAFSRPSHHFKRTLAMTVAGAMVVITAALIVDLPDLAILDVRTRFTNSDDSIQGLGGRSEIWQVAAEGLFNNPMIGCPLRTMEGDRISAHNTLVAAATMAGIPGLLLISSLIIIPLQESLRRRTNLCFPLLVVAVCGCTMDLLPNPLAWIVTGICVAELRDQVRPRNG